MPQIAALCTLMISIKAQVTCRTVAGVGQDLHWWVRVVDPNGNTHISPPSTTTTTYAALRSLAHLDSETFLMEAVSLFTITGTKTLGPVPYDLDDGDDSTFAKVQENARAMIPKSCRVSFTQAVCTVNERRHGDAVHRHPWGADVQYL